MNEDGRFPEGTVLEQIGQETWRLTTPGPTEEESRYLYPLPPQTFTWTAQTTGRAEAS